MNNNINVIIKLNNLYDVRNNPRIMPIIPITVSSMMIIGPALHAESDLKNLSSKN